MTNKQSLCINEMVRQLKLLVPTYLSYVGQFPDDINRIGQKFPAVIVEAGDETDFSFDTGKHLDYRFHINLYLYHEIKAGYIRQQDILTCQTAINDQITKDLTLGSTCQHLVITQITKGNETDTPYDTGYAGQLSVVKIEYEAWIYDTRST